MGVPANRTPPVTEAKIIAALAAGMTTEEVARGLSLHPSTVYRIAKREQNATLLAKLRDEIRAKTVEAIERTQPKLLDRLDREVDSGAARDVDALSRAALNLEKVASSASGEQRRQEADKPVQIVVRFADWVPPLKADVIEMPNDKAQEALQPAPDEAELLEREMAIPQPEGTEGGEADGPAT